MDENLTQQRLRVGVALARELGLPLVRKAVVPQPVGDHEAVHGLRRPAGEPTHEPHARRAALGGAGHVPERRHPPQVARDRNILPRLGIARAEAQNPVLVGRLARHDRGPDQG